MTGLSCSIRYEQWRLTMATTETKTRAQAVSNGAARIGTEGDNFPRPWTKPEDREGWQVVARGKRRRNRPPVRSAIIVSMDRAQIAWVREQAAASGLSEEDLMLRLIDEARQRP